MHYIFIVVTSNSLFGKIRNTNFTDSPFQILPPTRLSGSRCVIVNYHPALRSSNCSIILLLPLLNHNKENGDS